MKSDTEILNWLLGEPERLSWLHSLWFVSGERPKSPREAIEQQMDREDKKNSWEAKP